MKPFVLASTTSGNVSDHVNVVKQALEKNGFSVIGEYSPYDSAYIIVVTDDTLKTIAASHKRGAYAAVARISITKVGRQVQISYTNPAYLATACRVQGETDAIARRLKKSLGFRKEYGSDEGLDEDDLHEYRYTLGMEGFDDFYKLAEYEDYYQAVAAVEKGLAEHEGGADKVYRVDIPGQQQTLFGVALSSEKTGNKYMDDAFIMNEIDFRNIRSTAHLPYEILITGGKVEALHARFRIAINFPDLSMMGEHSFMNIMPTPEAIKKALTLAAGGRLEEEY